MAIINESLISDKIYLIRNHKVMIDRDLAELYGVETKRLKEAVKRNISRFPNDFMFTMTSQELQNWRSQFATSNSSEIMGLRHKPFCFTEQGVAMLSSVLGSEKAIKINIQIIRLFTKMRQLISANKDILLKLERLETKTSKHDNEIQMLINALRRMLNEPPQERVMIEGFKQKKGIKKTSRKK